MISLGNTKTIYDLVQNAGNEYKNKVFLRYEEKEIIKEKTYGQLCEDCNAISKWIEENNKIEGHRLHIAILGRSSYNYFTVFLGIIGAGSVVVPLDVQLKKENLCDNINRSDIDIIFYDWEFSSQIEFIKDNCKKVKQYISLQNISHIQCYDNILERYRGSEFISNVKPEDCAIIIFTSGTTGRGKGVMLSHGNLVDNIFCTTDEDLPINEVYLNVLPIHHIFCINGDLLIVMRYGSTLCLCNNLSKMMYYIKLFEPTAIRLVPMMAKVLYNKIVMTAHENPEMTMEDAKINVVGKRLHKIISGGGYLAEVISQNFAKLNITIGQGYGMSECSPKISVPDYNRPEKVASVGKIVDGCQVRIVEGEIQVKSPSVMMGYYKEPDKTAEAITADGWLRTGDIGYVDEENFLYLTGRKKNLIILSNGENVSPEAIEKLFDGEMLISDIFVYGNEEVISAEIYPNYKYAQAHGINNIEAEVKKIISIHNEELPSYERIINCNIRKNPFEKTSSKKIIRQKYFDEKKELKIKEDSIHRPENEMQQKLYNIVSGIIGNKMFGVDSNLYNCGLDSLGSILLIEELQNKFNKDITFNDLLENSTILKLENYLLNDNKKSKVDLSIREVYPLTGMQKYFAYIIKGNTTGNLPFTFKLDDSIDLGRLKKAIEDTIEAHPGLKAIIKFDKNQYKVFRDDSRAINIPIIEIVEEEWNRRLQELLVPFSYTEEDNLYHIYLFKTERSKYLFFDVAHIMGDGVTMNILLEDVNKHYCGEEVQKENYTFFEYILEEESRYEEGRRERDLEYFNNLMKNHKMKRSILNKKDKGNYLDGTNAAIRKRFNNIIKEEVLEFCKKNSVSENVLFLTVFNYCISLFSDEDDVFSTSIHSGRTDNRWTRLAGPLFLTYYCRFKKVPHERVSELLYKTAKQIMNTMTCYTPTPREGEMFFQYQGDIININKIGDARAERIRLQLDSLPFHMQVMSDDKGYYMELRYWENRFDKEQIEIFLLCYESILAAMLEERSVRRLKHYIPEEAYPKHYYVKVSEINKEAGYNFITDIDEEEDVKVYVLDERYNKKPYGAWGKLYIMEYKSYYYNDEIENPYGEGILYETDKIARILPNGSIDFLENGGRTVLTDGSNGRKYYDLRALEKSLYEYKGIDYVEAYLSYNPKINEMSLITDIKAKEIIDTDKVKEYIQEKCSKELVPDKINYIGKY